MIAKITITCAALVLAIAEPPIENYSRPELYGAPAPKRNSAVFEPPAAVVSFNLFRGSGSKGGRSENNRQYGLPEVGETERTSSGTNGYQRSPQSKNYGPPGNGLLQTQGMGHQRSQHFQEGDTYNPQPAVYYPSSSTSYDRQNMLPHTEYSHSGPSRPKTDYGVPLEMQEADMQEPASYDFLYHVMAKDGSEYGHEESREGDEAHGKYHVLLPDGRMQVVTYTADKGGFKPIITFKETHDKGNNPY